MSQRQIGITMAITTGLCWALLAIALKYALQFTSAGNVVWVRMMIAFLFVFGVFAIRQPQKMSIMGTPPLLGLIAGLCLAGNYFGYMKGVELTSASNTQIMIQSAPMTFALVGILYFKEKPTIQQILGMLIAIFGFSFFYWDQLLVAVNQSATYIRGNFWILFAAATWVVFATNQKILTSRWSPQQINLLIYLVASMALMPLANWSELAQLSLWQWGFLAVLGLNTVVAYGALGEALKRIPAAHVSLIISLNPLLTIALLKLMEFLEIQWVSYEPLNWRGYLGALLVVSGVVLTVSVGHRRLKAAAN